MMKGGGGPEVKTTHILSYPPNLVPFRAKTLMNYTDYGGQLRTPKLSLADAGGGASSDIVTTFALFLLLRLP